MHPIFIRLGPLDIHTYGVLVAIGFMVGLAVAGAFVGFMLSAYGYQGDAIRQTPSAVQGIVLLFTVIPGVGYSITAGIVRLLKVDRPRMRQIQDDLEKRRENYREGDEWTATPQLETKHP